MEGGERESEGRRGFHHRDTEGMEGRGKRQMAG